MIIIHSYHLISLSFLILTYFIIFTPLTSPHSRSDDHHFIFLQQTNKMQRKHIKRSSLPRRSLTIILSFFIFSLIVLSDFWVIIEFVSKEISTRVGLISMGKCHPPKFSDGDKRPSVLSCFLLLGPQIWTSPKIHPRACVQDGNEGRGSSQSHKKTEHGHRNSGQQGTKHVFVSKLLAS